MNVSSSQDREEGCCVVLLKLKQSFSTSTKIQEETKKEYKLKRKETRNGRKNLKGHPNRVAARKVEQDKEILPKWTASNRVLVLQLLTISCNIDKNKERSYNAKIEIHLRKFVRSAVLRISWDTADSGYPETTEDRVSHLLQLYSSPVSRSNRMYSLCINVTPVDPRNEKCMLEINNKLLEKSATARFRGNSCSKRSNRKILFLRCLRLVSIDYLRPTTFQVHHNAPNSIRQIQLDCESFWKRSKSLFGIDLEALFAFARSSMVLRCFWTDLEYTHKKNKSDFNVLLSFDIGFRTNEYDVNMLDTFKTDRKVKLQHVTSAASDTADASSLNVSFAEYKSRLYRSMKVLKIIYFREWITHTSDNRQIKKDGDDDDDDDDNDDDDDDQ
ncbi:hypothetical protein V1477_016902 [Vespula maculifrons]|uniref:Uncharacterized protein n=1 Tax=Vespula maculifrons TaxID=7453 RepID=A0ABD2B4M2_VESMC